MVGILLLLPAVQVAAQDTRAAQPDRTVELSSPAQIDSQLAGMSDAQIRQAYAQKLKQDAQEQSVSSQASGKGRSANKVIDSFYGAARTVAAVLKRVGGIFSAEDRSAVQWSDVVSKLSNGKGTPYLFGTLAGLAVIIALGLVLRWLFLRTTSDIRKNLIRAARLGKLQFLGRLLSRMLLDALGVCIYILLTFALFAMFYREGNPNYTVVSVYLIISYYIMLFAYGARVVFSPKAPSLRLFPMADEDASFLY